MEVIVPVIHDTWVSIGQQNSSVTQASLIIHIHNTSEIK